MGAEMDGVGSLQSSLDELERKWGNKRAVVYIVGASAGHAAAVELGTAPHTITADSGYLSFTVDGEQVFAKSVDHPGTPAQPYMRPAARAVERDLPTIAKASSSIEDLIRRAAIQIEAEAKRRAPVDDGDLRASIQFRPA